MDRNTGKPLRLSSGRFDLSDDLVLLCIPEWFRAALLDLTGRMLWSRVWTNLDGSDYDLTEGDRQRIEYGIYKLAQRECDMEIINNINVTCGGCAGAEPSTIICYLQDGTPVLTPQPPVNPIPPPPPVGDGWPVNPVIDLPPDDFEDWTVFDVKACAAANALYDLVYAWVTIAEGAVDTLTSILAAMVLLVPATAAEVIAIIGGSSLVSLATELIDLIVSEQASDILNEVKSWLENNKPEIVCLIFSYRYDIPTMRLEIVTSMLAWVGAALTLTDEELASLRDWGKSLFPLNLLLAYFFELDRYVEAVEPYDCSLCSAGQWTYNTDNNDGTWAINYQANTAIDASGLSPTAGSTQVHASISRAGGATFAAACHAIRFQAAAFGCAGAANYELRIKDTNGERTVNIFNALVWLDTSVLIKTDSYAGPEIESHVLSTGETYALIVSNSANPDESSTAFLFFRYISAGQPQTQAYIQIYDLAFLDEIGNELDPDWGEPS